MRPICGFSGTPYWIGIRKLRAMVEGTAIVRRELGGPRGQDTR